jgi:N-acetylmuramoyl-L-alanine amidase
MNYKDFYPRTLIALVLATGAVGGSHAAEVAGVRLSWSESATRVVLDLSGPVRHKLFALENPHRVVLDVPRSALRRGLQLPAGQGVVTAIRAGRQPGNTLRLVFDTRGAVAAQVLAVDPSGEMGYRLIVSLGEQARMLPGNTALNSAPAAASAVSEPPRSEPLTREVRAAHAPANSGRDIVVAVDAGHGGVDPGASGHRGTREKDVVLEIAREVAQRLNREPGMKAVLTRDGDYFISLRERILRARRAKADLFVSVHADAVGRADVSGSSVYVLSERGASSEAARWLAERENAADLKGGVSLDDKDATLANVLLDLSQTASISESMEAAQRVLTSLDGIGVVRKPQVQQAGFVVLKSPDIPSMLVETAFISNREDERRLRDPAYRDRVAGAIFAGIRRYFADSAPDGTRLAVERRAAGGAATAGVRELR